MSEKSTLRRDWLLTALAGVVAAGAGFNLYRQRLRTPEDGALERLWAQELETPSGAHLPLQAFRGRPLLVNFWATWCPPCVKEMPDLDRFATEQAAAGWQVVGLAVDQRDAVRDFLSTTPVRFPVALAGVAGMDLARALGNSAGALPFTVVISGAGTIVERKLGASHLEEMSGWARQHGRRT